MLFLQLAPVHSPSTARLPNHPLQSRSSISSLLPCYFCTSSLSTAHPPDHPLQSPSSISSLLPCYFCTPARPQPVHRRPPDPDLQSRSSISSLLPCSFCSSRPSTARPPPVHQILTFDLALPSPPPAPVHSSSTARPPDPDLRSRSSISSLLPCYFCSSRPSTARPPPVHRILTFDLAPPSLASSHAISAPPARPQLVHRPSTGSWPSISLLHL